MKQTKLTIRKFDKFVVTPTEAKYQFDVNNNKRIYRA